MSIQNAEWKLQPEWEGYWPVYVAQLDSYLLELVKADNVYHFFSPIVSKDIIAKSLEEAIEKVKVIWTNEAQELIIKLQATL